MTYELAKQLKDTGFPQKSYLLKFVKRENGETSEVNSSSWDEAGFGEDLEVISPTLAELIEACGDRFDCLIRKPDGTWVCYEPNKQLWAGVGETPEEAVANLWLELNKK